MVGVGVGEGEGWVWGGESVKIECNGGSKLGMNEYDMEGR